MLLSDPEALQVSEGPFAVDTEFHAENRYHPRLHLLQVRTADGPAQLIDPHDRTLMAAVAPRLLSRPWIVHSGRVDLRILSEALGGVPEVVHDTQIAAGLVQTRYPASLADLLAGWCDVHLAKAETLSDWSRRPLSPAQLEYAALDVAHLHALWEALIGRARELGREALVHAACAEARQEAIVGPDPSELWKSLPGGRGLEPKAAGVLRKLVAWREGVAASQDRPPMTVLGNRILMDLAKRRPSTADELANGRRAPKKTLATHGEELLEAIRSGQIELDGTAPRLRPGTAMHAEFTWWTAFAESLAQQEGWSARLVLPRSLCEDLAGGAPLPTGWRQDVIGADVEAARRGELRLRLPSTR